MVLQHALFCWGNHCQRGVQTLGWGGMPGLGADGLCQMVSIQMAGLRFLQGGDQYY